MTQPSFGCPRCGYETFLPSDIASGYCPSCHWWTGDSLLGSEDVMAQNEIDGPLSLVSPDRSDIEALIWDDPYAFVGPSRAEVEADWFGDASRPTLRVARFVGALRRLRRR